MCNFIPAADTNTYCVKWIYNTWNIIALSGKAGMKCVLGGNVCNKTCMLLKQFHFGFWLQPTPMPNSLLCRANISEDIFLSSYYLMLKPLKSRELLQKKKKSWSETSTRDVGGEGESLWGFENRIAKYEFWNRMIKGKSVFVNCKLCTCW